MNYYHLARIMQLVAKPDWLLEARSRFEEPRILAFEKYERNHKKPAGIFRIPANGVSFQWVGTPRKNKKKACTNQPFWGSKLLFSEGVFQMLRVERSHFEKSHFMGNFCTSIWVIKGSQRLIFFSKRCYSTVKFAKWISSFCYVHRCWGCLECVPTPSLVLFLQKDWYLFNTDNTHVMFMIFVAGLFRWCVAWMCLLWNIQQLLFNKSNMSSWFYTWLEKKHTTHKQLVIQFIH